MSSPSRRLWLPVALILALLMVSDPQASGAELFDRADVRRAMLAPTPSASSAPLIRLKAATFAPSLGERPNIPATLSHSASSVRSESETMLVQFAGPVAVKWRRQMEAAGAEVLDYIPDYAYKVALPLGSVEDVRQLEGVVWVGPFHPAYSISPGTRSRDSDLVRVETHHASDTLEADLKALGVRIIGREGDILAVEADSRQVEAIALLPGVEWIESLQMARTHNDVAADLIHAGSAWQGGYAGEDQLVGVADTGLDTGRDYPQIPDDMHRDIEGRVSHIRSWPISPLWHGMLNNPTDDDGAADLDYGHGTHVAGSAVGSGARSGGLYRGIAHRAQLTFQALEQYCNWNAAAEAAGYRDGYYLVGVPAYPAMLLDEAYRWGIRVHSNSWGYEDEAVYTLASRNVDLFLWEHRDMVVLYSAGNEARDGNGDGRTDPGSIVAPATAKNIIAVGGAESLRPDRFPTYGLWYGGQFGAPPIRDDIMADAGATGMLAFSGRGPTTDGRTAPHVVAPGTWIASMRSSVATNLQDPWGFVDPFYMLMGGTSMSTPIVAGAAALVRQAYMDRGRVPSASLVKATLIQTARDMPGQYPPPYEDAAPIPNSDEGWGCVDVGGAVAPGRHVIDEERALETAQEHVYIYQAGGLPRPARFTLVWTDYPAAVEAGPALVNDLDLEVIAPNGTRYRGNEFATGWSVPGTKVDRLNNVECVYLPVSSEGAYRVIIRGHNVPMGPQDYALLVDLPQPHSSYVRVPLIMRLWAFPSPTPSRTPSPSPSPVATVGASPTPSTTASVAPTLSSPTATPELTPTSTPTASPTASQGGWCDDFETNDGAWIEIVSEDYAMSYAEGEYSIRVSPARGRAGSLPARTQEGDFVLSVSGRAANGADQGYGILFNYEDQGPAVYQAFLVSPEGSFAIIRQDGSYVIPWTPSTLVLAGEGVNRLTVRRAGRRIECSVNDVLVAIIQGAEYTSGSRYGLISVSRGAEWSHARFDDFCLTPSGATPSPNAHAGARIDATHLAIAVVS